MNTYKILPKNYGGGVVGGGGGGLSNGTIEYSWQNATVMCPSFLLAPSPLFCLDKPYLLHRDKKDYDNGYRMVAILAVLALSREVERGEVGANYVKGGSFKVYFYVLYTVYHRT